MAGQGGLITITIGGGEQIRLTAKKLASWGFLVKSVEPAWELIGEDLQADFARNMIQGGGFFGGGAWTPLAPSTIADKRRTGFGAMPIMWRTGELAHSLSDRGAKGNVFQAGADYLVVGTTLFYAAYHQFGSREKKKLTKTVTRVTGGYQLGVEKTEILPKRLLVGISWRRRSLIIQRINLFVKEMARQAGLSARGGGGGNP